MNIDEYVSKSAPATDQRGEDDSVAIPGLLSDLSRAAVDAGASYVQAGPDMRERTARKLGDVLWYVAAVTRRSKLTLSQIASQNLGGKAVSTFHDYASQLAVAGDAGAAPLSLSGLVGATVTTAIGYLQTEPERSAQVQQGLGDTLRHIAAVARQLDLLLSDIAVGNLERVGTMFGSSPDQPRFFDDSNEVDEQLPRRLTLRLSEFNRNDLPTVRVTLKTADGIWLPVGSPLNDNSHIHDDYRFHDVFHLAYMAVLGWSPVMRALFGVKRKSQSAKDRVEDGARAALLEEALTGLIYEHAIDNKFFENAAQLERRLLLQVKRLTRGLEVKVRTYENWTKAILDGYRVFRDIKQARADLTAQAGAGGPLELGLVEVDMNERTIAFRRHVASAAASKPPL